MAEKAPPVLKEGVLYEAWLHDISAWELITKTEAAKRGVQVYLYGLEGKFKDYISKIPIKDLNVDEGVKVITDKLDTFCAVDKSQRAFSSYEKLHSFRRKSNQPVQEALLVFDGMVTEVQAQKVVLPDEVLAFHVLKAMNLSESEERLAKATVAKLDYTTMVDKIKTLSSNASSSDCGEFDSVEIKAEPDDVYYTRGRGFGFRGRSRGFNPRGRGRFYKSNESTNSDGTQRKCYICESPDHLSYQCPNKQNSTSTSFSASGRKCFKCGKEGHMAYSCPEKRGGSGGPVHITLLQSSLAVGDFLGETLGHAVVDSACKHTLAGSVWMDEYLGTLSDTEKEEVSEEECSMRFRFGDGVEVKSEVMVTIPVCIIGTKCRIKVAVINNELPLLLSIESMKKGSVKLNFGDESIECLGKITKMKTTSSGHVILPLTRKVVSNESDIVLDVSNLSRLSKKERFTKMKKLHVQFSHASKESLWRLLNSSGIKDRLLRDALEEVTGQCDVCLKYKKRPLRPCVSEPLAEGFNATLAMDLKTVEKDRVYILHLIDLGTRYSAAGVIRSKHQDVIVKRVLSLWIQTFGAPRRFLTDNGGEFSNDSFREMCEQFNVVSATTPGESPWSNGVVERHNGVLMETVRRTMEECKCDLETALSWSISAKNTLSNISGYSPNVLVFGRNPNLPSVLSDSVPALEHCTRSELVRNTINVMYSARKGFVASEASEKIRRALRMKMRVSNNLVVNNGDSVYFRRLNYKGWKGPGTVVARDNKLIMVRHGGELYRVPLCDILPVCVADQYTVSEDGESDVENQKSEHPVEPVDTEDVEDENSIGSASGDDSDGGVDDQDSIGSAPRDDSNVDEVVTDDAEELEVEYNGSILPEVSSKVKFLEKDDDQEHWRVASILSGGGKKCGRNKNYLNIQVVGEQKPKGVFWDRYVSVWKLLVVEENVLILTPGEYLRDDICQAKDAELENWKHNRVYEKVIDTGQKTISSRWVVTEKETVGTNEKKTKARLVCRGYEEDVTMIRTDSPTCTKESLRLLYSLGASYRWRCQSLDVRAAFLQGDEISREIYMKPPRGVEEKGYIWRLLKCPYGLSDAPRTWYDKVKSELLSAGVEISRYDEAFFFYRVSGVLHGVMAVHVDDFVYVGSKRFICDVIQKLVTAFEISIQQCGNFKYVGLDLIQVGSEIQVNQDVYIQGLEGIVVSPRRAQDIHDVLNSDERAEVKHVCGQLLWLANNTRPDLSYETCQLCNVGKSAVVGDLGRINKLIKRAKQESVKTRYPSLGDPKDWIVVVYCDSSFANLPDGASQGGFIVFLSSPGNKVAPMSWQSKKLNRVTRSTLSSETLAMVEGVDAGFLVMKQIEEMLLVKPPVVVYTDNRSLHQTVHTSHVIRDKSLRVNVGFLRQLVNNHEIEVKWIESQQQLADALTKQGASAASLIRVLNTAHL